MVGNALSPPSWYFWVLDSYPKSRNTEFWHLWHIYVHIWGEPVLGLTPGELGHQGPITAGANLWQALSSVSFMIFFSYTLVGQNNGLVNF